MDRPLPHRQEAFDASQLRWVHPAQQARARQRLERLLDVAERLIAARGVDDVAVTELCAAAGCSVGSFYRRFHGKNGLVQALHERFCAEACATADQVLKPERWLGVPTVAVLTEVARFLVEVYRSREGLIRAFLARAIADPEIHRRNRRMFSHLSMRTRELLAAREGDFDHPDPERASRFAVHLLLGALNHFVQLRPGELRGFTEPVERELARTLCRYLGLRNPQVARRRSAS